jgi:drug/metabolite transporter (DMT)-like permease
MTVGVLAVSTSGPLMAAMAAPALAIAFWRNMLASGVLVPAALTARRAELRSLTGSERRLAVAAGVLLAAHFATWVPSLSYTSVASATALVSTQPVWTALLARRGGERLPRTAWVGIAVAVVGAGVVSGVDITVSGRAFFGDLLAVAGGMFAAAYTIVGNRVRQSVSTTTYTSACYLTAALTLLLVCVASGQHLGGYPAKTWLELVALTVGPQLLGHSMFNYVLRRTSATLVALSILFEVPGATLLAAVWLHQHPPAGVLPGLVLLLLGLGAVVAGRTRSEPPSVPVE